MALVNLLTQISERTGKALEARRSLAQTGQEFNAGRAPVSDVRDALSNFRHQIRKLRLTPPEVAEMKSACHG